MKPSLTPLRYPGGKGWLLDYVQRFIRKNTLEISEIVEPYAGTAAVSIGLLKSDMVQEAIICESDYLITSFWNAVKYKLFDFVESVKSIEISMETWYSLRKYLDENPPANSNVVEVATAFLFFNRTNYSGIINAGPIGGKSQKSVYSLGCRFNKERIIKRLLDLEPVMGMVKVIQGDGLQFMEKIVSDRKLEKPLFYVDPPYYYAGKELYRDYFDDDNHRELASFLLDLKYPWLLSYDDADFIKELYKDTKNAQIYTDYQANKLKDKEKELLISNKVIPPGSSPVNFKYTPVVNLKYIRSAGSLGLN